MLNQIKSVLLDKHREYFLLLSKELESHNNSKREDTNKYSSIDHELGYNVKSAQNSNRKSKTKSNRDQGTATSQQQSSQGDQSTYHKTTPKATSYEYINCLQATCKSLQKGNKTFQFLSCTFLLLPKWGYLISFFAR